MTEYERICRELAVLQAIKLRAMLSEGGIAGQQEHSVVHAVREFLLLDWEALEHLGPLRKALGLKVPTMFSADKVDLGIGHNETT